MPWPRGLSAVRGLSEQSGKSLASLRRYGRLAFPLILHFWVPTFSLVQVPTLNKMAWQAPVRSGLNTAPKAASDQLLDMLNGRSRLYKALIQVRKTCDNAGASDQWHAFSGQLLQAFHSSGIQNITRDGQNSLDDLVKLVYEIERVAQAARDGHAAASAVWNKTVCYLISLLSLSRSKTDTQILQTDPDTARRIRNALEAYTQWQAAQTRGVSQLQPVLF